VTEPQTLDRTILYTQTDYRKMPSATPDYSLTEEQKQHFLEHGFIKLENCFSVDDEQCKGLMDRVWERLDMDPNDRETWNPWRGKIHSLIMKTTTSVLT
jgi:hypothetical protein